MNTIKPIDNPFIPEGMATAVVVDGRISKGIEHKIQALGIDIIKMPYCKELYSAIASHPDILMHPIDFQTLVVAPNVYDGLKVLLEDRGLNIIRGKSILTGNYPDNVAYNIGRIGKYAIHNFNYTDRLVLELLEKRGVERIHVKQGYSKCSICIVGERAVITSDRGIQKELEKKSIDALLISSGYIELPGLSHGFIGGATGLLEKNRLAFTGNLRSHPDYKTIVEFLKKYHVEPLFLDCSTIIDYGSIIPLYEIK